MKTRPHPNLIARRYLIGDIFGSMYPYRAQRERFTEDLYHATWALRGDHVELTFAEWIRLVEDYPLLDHPSLDDVVVTISKAHIISHHKMGFDGCDPPDEYGGLSVDIRYVGPGSGNFHRTDLINSSNDALHDGDDFERMITELFHPAATGDSL